MNSLEQFAEDVVENLPAKWNTNIDNQSIQSTNRTQVGFRRDDLCSFILEVPPDTSWPSDTVYIHIPNTVASIPDRPGNDLIEVNAIASEISQTLIEELPEYEGEFTYNK